MNSKTFLIASIVLGIVILSPVKAAELPTTANDEFITIFLHGFDKGLQKPALRERYFDSDDILREGQGWSNAFEYTLYGGEELPFEGRASGLRELDILEYPSDGFLQEIGDFNTGSRGTEFLDGNSVERNQSRQPWLGLARAEWVYRQQA